MIRDAFVRDSDLNVFFGNIACKRPLTTSLPQCQNERVNNRFGFPLGITSKSCGGISICGIPQAFFNPVQGLRLQFKDTDRFGKHEFEDPTILPLFDWTKVQLSQETGCGKIVHRVMINGMEKYRKEFSSARIFTNLEVYASGPYSADIPNRGYIKGLSVQIREEPKLQQRITQRDL